MFLDLNGWLVTDPEMRLYDGMIGFATGDFGKAEFAELLRLLSAPLGETEDGPEP